MLFRSPFYDCYRVVYHVHSIEDLDSIYRTGSEIVRVVFVVTSQFTVQDIMDITAYVDKSTEIDELSFREYVDASFTPLPLRELTKIHTGGKNRRPALRRPQSEMSAYPPERSTTILLVP